MRTGKRQWAWILVWYLVPTLMAQEAKPRIREIPTLPFSLPPSADAFPQKSGRFSLNAGRLSDSRVQQFKPVAHAAFGTDGGVAVSFPLQNLVAVYPTSGPSRYYGLRRYGGNNEPLTAPGHIALWGDQLLAASRQSDLVVHLDATGKVLQVDGVGGQINPIVGPGPVYLSAGNQAALFFRKAGSNKGLPYGLGHLAQSAQDAGENTALLRSAQYDLLEDGSVVFVYANLEKLLHFQANGLVQLQLLQLEARSEEPAFHGTKPLRVRGVAYHNQQYWVLVSSSGSATANPHFLVRFSNRGGQGKAWSLPFEADGLDVYKDQVLFFQREIGAVFTLMVP